MGAPSESVVVPDGEGCRLRVRVQPGARHTEVVGVHGGELRVRVASPPVDGKANDALCRCLASLVGVKPRDAIVVAGHASRSKVVQLAVSAEVAAAALARWISPDRQAGR